jgi:hypothetical protein
LADRMDQMVGAYYRNTKFRWHVKLMLHIGLIALNNAHITYLDLTNQTRTDMPFMDFLCEVVDELKPTPKHARRQTQPGTVHTHTPVYTYGTKAMKKRTKWDEGVKGEGRWYGRRCAGCGTSKSRYMCSECGVYLHLHDEEKGHSCWGEYHLKNL